MNYFRCTVGGSGKGNTVTVTCAEEFAGLTITLAKTGKTYTKTCPSTAPYVVTYYGVENGTYTVSTTYEGQTYSETVIVQDISCVLNYGFNWQIWVDTASQLDSSDYNSLDEVLADEKALRELFLEHACVDYMASFSSSNEALETVINNDLCAKWINLSDYALDFLHANEVIADLMDEADKYGYGEWALMPQAPKMTSNTAPFGEVIGTTPYQSSANYAAWKAFDGDSSTACILGTTTTVELFIGYHFVNPTIIQRIVFLSSAYSVNTSSTYKIQASNDGSNWTDIDDSFTVDYGGDYITTTRELNNSNAYSYYRIYRTATTIPDNKMLYCTTVQFYAWAPKGNVPVMTSNTAPYGTASASSQYNNDYAPWKAFRKYKVDGYYWSTANGSSYTTNQRLSYKFTNPVKVRKISLQNNQHTERSVKNFIVQYSQDGSRWVDASDTLTNGNTVYQITDYNVDNDVYALYWCIYVLNNNGSSTEININSLQFYGRELKVSVPTMTSNTAPFGEAISNALTVQYHNAYRAFDDDDSTTWACSDSSGVANSYLGYHFTNPICVKRVYVKVLSSNQAYSFKVQHSDDNSTWMDTDGETHQSSANGDYFDVENSSYHLYWRIFIPTAADTDNTIALQFYGFDYSEKEFEAGTTKKWLYDHGVELETLESRQYTGSGGTAEKEDFTIKMTTGTSNNVVGVRPTSGAINMSDYSLMRAKIGNVFKNALVRMIVDDVNDVTWNASTFTAMVAFNIGDANTPDKLSLDVSAVTGNQYVHFCDEIVTNGTSGIACLDEWWLE